MALAPKKVRLAPDSEVAVAVREAEKQGTPIDFEDGEATYRFVPQTCSQVRDEPPTAWKGWFRQPTPEELARRQEVGARILANRKHRTISPYTAADLVHAAREKRTLDE